jgi:hypothetical protein
MPDDRRGVPATTSPLSSRPATPKDARYTRPQTMRSHASSMSVSGEARSCPRFVCSVACEQLGPVVQICRRPGRWKAASGRCLIASLHRCTATAEPAVHAPGSTWMREAFCTTARIECACWIRIMLVCCTSGGWIDVCAIVVPATWLREAFAGVNVT